MERCIRKNRNFKNIHGVLEQVSSNALLQTFNESRYELRPHAERTFIDKLIEQVNRENYALSVPFLILAADELALSGRCPRQEAMDKLFFQLKPEHLKTRPKGKVMKSNQGQNETDRDAAAGSFGQSDVKPKASYALFEYEFQFTDGVYTVELLEVRQTEEEPRIVTKGHPAVLYRLNAGCYVIGVKKSDGRAVRTRKRSANPVEPVSPATSTESGSTGDSVSHAALRQRLGAAAESDPESAAASTKSAGCDCTMAAVPDSVLCRRRTAIKAKPFRSARAALPVAPLPCPDMFDDWPSYISTSFEAGQYADTDLLVEVTSTPLTGVAHAHSESIPPCVERYSGMWSPTNLDAEGVDIDAMLDCFDSDVIPQSLHASTYTGAFKDRVPYNQRNREVLAYNHATPPPTKRGVSLETAATLAANVAAQGAADSVASAAASAASQAAIDAAAMAAVEVGTKSAADAALNAAAQAAFDAAAKATLEASAKAAADAALNTAAQAAADAAAKAAAKLAADAAAAAAQEVALKAADAATQAALKAASDAANLALNHGVGFSISGGIHSVPHKVVMGTFAAVHKAGFMSSATHVATGAGANAAAKAAAEAAAKAATDAAAKAAADAAAKIAADAATVAAAQAAAEATAKAALDASAKAAADVAANAAAKAATDAAAKAALEASAKAAADSALNTATEAMLRAALKEKIALALRNGGGAALGIALADGAGALRDVYYFRVGALSAQQYAERLESRCWNLLRNLIGGCGGAALGTLLLTPIMGPFFASLLGGIVGGKVMSMFNEQLNPVGANNAVAHLHQS